MGDQRRVAEPAPQVDDAVGEHVVARLDAVMAVGGHDPLVGVERPQLVVRVEPRVELHGAQPRVPRARRSSTAATIDPAGSSPGSVRYQ